MAPKIATCCYCGTRSTLRLDTERHELTCGNCGAPLRNLKQISIEKKSQNSERRKEKKVKKAKLYGRFDNHYEPRRKPRRRRKGLMSKVLEEAFDVIEDIFD